MMQTERRNRRARDRIMPALIPLALCMMLVSSVLSIGALRSVHRIDDNAKKLATAASVQHDVAVGARNAVRLACKTNNELRGILRGLVVQGNASLKQYREEGLLTQAQYERAVKQQKNAQRRLKNTRCKEAAKIVPLPTATATQKEG